MKRLVIVLAVCMLLPLNAFALQPLDEGNMGEITGQAGVSIAVDDVKLYQNIGYLSYTDSDGIGGTAGTVSISNLYMMVNINAITSLNAAGLPVSPGRLTQGTYTNAAGDALFDFTNTATAAGNVFIAKALTIDVGTMPVLSAGMSNNATIAAGGTPTTVTVAGVRIGLPTVEIHQTELSFDVTVESGTAVNSGASYGRIGIGENTLCVLDGSIEIAPH